VGIKNGKTLVALSGGLASGVLFYLPPLAPFVFLTLLPLLWFGRLKEHLTFGLGFSLGALFPLLKAALLIATDGAPHFLLPLYAAGGLLLFLAVAVAFALLQFGGTWALNRLLRFYPLSFTLVEFLRAKFLFNGLPYFLLGHLWGYFPFFNLAYGVFPVYLFTLAVLLISYLIKRGAEKPSLTRAVLPYLLLIPLGLTSYLHLKGLNYKLPEIPLVVVQPFLSQADKLKNQSLLLPYLELLVLKTPPRTLVVLPETTLDYRQSPDDFVAAFPDRDFLMGVQRLKYDLKAQKLVALNEVILAVGGRVADRYVKKFLVPFGEYTPAGFSLLARLFPYFGGIDYAAGKNFKTFNYKGVKISPLICNEVFFLPPLKGDLIAVHTNDAWFFKPFVTYHRLVAKIEAIKTSKVVIFANNDGGSALLLPDGREVNCKNLRVCPLLYSP